MRQAACFLLVDGEVYLDGPCDVFDLGQDTYTLNAWTNGKPAQSHFAQITAMADGTFAASWNADPSDNRAGDDLGNVILTDGCWVNDRVKICAR
jgi:hypothetical protein